MATKVERYSPQQHQFKSDAIYSMKIEKCETDKRKLMFEIYEVGQSNSVPEYVGIIDARSKEFDNVRFGLKGFELGYVDGFLGIEGGRYMFFPKNGHKSCLGSVEITKEDADLVARNSFPISDFVKNSIPSDMRFD
jgi:hypothetical protein